MPSTQIMIDLFLTIVTIPVITSIEDIQSCNRIKVSKSASDSVILHNRIQEKQLNGPAKIFYLWNSLRKKYVKYRLLLRTQSLAKDDCILKNDRGNASDMN